MRFEVGAGRRPRRSRYPPEPPPPPSTPLRTEWYFSPRLGPRAWPLRSPSLGGSRNAPVALVQPPPAIRAAAPLLSPKPTARRLDLRVGPQDRGPAICWTPLSVSASSFYAVLGSQERSHAYGLRRPASLVGLSRKFEQSDSGWQVRLNMC